MMPESHLDTIFDAGVGNTEKCEWYNKILIHMDTSKLSQQTHLLDFVML